MPESYFNKIAGLMPATLLKKRLWHRCFPVNFTKFLRTPFFTERLQWLLLLVVISSLSLDLLKICVDNFKKELSFISFYFSFQWTIKSKRESNHNYIIRTSPSQMFLKIGVLKNFAIFTENLCRNLVVNKVVGWRH